MYLALGYIFRGELEWIAAMVSNACVSLGILIALTVASYIAWKWRDRRLFLRKLKMARITPEELWTRMQAGEEITVLDLRHEPDVLSGGAILPGARRFPPEELELRYKEVPRDRDIVLYCS